MNPKIIKKNFEKSIDKYNDNAFVQKIMAERLVSTLLNYRNNFDNILELGSGTGLLTKEINKNLKFKNYHANDLVKKSENYVKNIIPNAQFYLGNALKIKPSQKFDLIISNAMFQWFQDLKKPCQIFKSMLNKDGILAFTTFSPENYKEIKSITGLSLNYFDTKEIEEIFSKHFNIIKIEEYEKVLSFSNPLEMLAHMKNTGVNSLSAKTWTFKDVKDFCDKFSDKYPATQLTYSIISVLMLN